MASEVIVTAQKRAERLQDVPLSISAITERRMEQQGITRFEDYASRAAGIHLSREASQTTFSVRGIATSTTAGTSSAPAGIYIDDYPVFETYFRTTSPDLRLFDVDRIEVLRGPQGTLYGSTSLSGSVRIITNKPNLSEVGGKVESTLSSTEGGGTNHTTNAMANIPLVTDKVGIRAVGFVRQDDGYVDNFVRGHTDVDGQESYGGRFYLNVVPTEDLSLLASVSYQHDTQDEQSATYYFPPVSRDITDYNSQSAANYYNNLLVTTLAAELNVGNGNLSLTGIYAETKTRGYSDFTGIAVRFGLPTPTALFTPSDSNATTVEARYVSNASMPLKHIVGAYYSQRQRSVGQHADQPGFQPIFGTSTLYEVAGENRAIELAAFGQTTWAFTEQWEATIGLRAFKNIFSQNVDISGLINSIRFPEAHTLTNARNSESSVIPQYSLSYKPVGSVNIYATASKGYRFGLANYNTGLNSTVPLTYKSDTLWNYELGAKATTWNGRVSLNSALYYIDWNHIQLNFRNAFGQTYTSNVGTARSYGFESELAFQVTSALQLNAALSIGRAELSKDAPGVERRAASVRGGRVIDALKGDRLPGSSEASASGGIQYNFRNIGAGEAYVRVDDTYVGPSYIDFMKEGSLDSGYNVVDLRVCYQARRYQVTAFVNNLFNSSGIVSAASDTDGLGTDAAYKVRPRTTGVTVRANF